MTDPKRVTRRAALGLICTAATVRPVMAGQVDARAYGALGDGVHDDWQALNRAYAACVAMRRPLYIAAGHYRIEHPLIFDMSAASRTGIAVCGDGAQATVLDFAVSDWRANLVFCGSGSARDMFYLNLHDFGVQGCGSGPVLQIGNDDLSYVVNACSLERLVVCANGQGPAVTLNAVCGGHVDVVANAADRRHGISMRMRQVQFCTIAGAQGNAEVGTWMGDGYNFGNVFTAIDYEVLGTAVRIEGEHCVHNTWIGGTIANTGSGFDCLAGRDNCAVNVNPAIGAELMVRRSVGMRLSPPLGTVRTPALPPSGDSVVNDTGRAVQVGLMGGQVDYVAVNGVTLGRMSNLVVFLPAGAAIRVTYRLRPAWAWTEAG